MRLGRTIISLRALPRAGRGVPRGRSGSCPPRGAERQPSPLQRPPACVLRRRGPSYHVHPGPSPQSGRNTNTPHLNAQLHSGATHEAGWRKHPPERTPATRGRLGRPGDGSTHTHDGCLGPPAPRCPLLPSAKPRRRWPPTVGADRCPV